MSEVFITSAVRTAVGSFNGSLSGMPAHDLGTIVIKETLNRSGIEGGDVDEVILGQVLTAATGQNPARQASINAGLNKDCLLYTSPSPRDRQKSRMPSSA